MSFNPIEFNQILGQSSEVAKIKKKQLDKKRLEEIEEEKKAVQEQDKFFINKVTNKDPEIGLDKNEEPSSPPHPQSKKDSNISEVKKIIRENYKGNFLDISE